jgi:hypothetical protein
MMPRQRRRRPQAEAGSGQLRDEAVDGMTSRSGSCPPAAAPEFADPLAQGPPAGGEVTSLGRNAESMCGNGDRRRRVEHALNICTPYAYHTVQSSRTVEVTPNGQMLSASLRSGR